MKLSAFLCLTLVLLINYSCEKKPSLPVVKTDPPSGITTTAAISGGEITDDGGAAIIIKGVCWDITDNPTIENNKATGSTNSASFVCNLSNLSPGTMYFIRAFATNSAGTSYGESVNFRTLGDKPVPQANSVSNITINSATLTGAVNPNMLSTTALFEWGTSITYGNTAQATGSPLSGSSSSDVSVSLIGLAPGTTYHFRVRATNDLGIAVSDDMQFTTLGQAPAAIAQSATDLQVRGATLNGSINPNYLSTTVSFEWGITTSYGNSLTLTESHFIGSTAISISAGLTGLTPGTTYHFRIKASNELGTTISNDISFKTAGQVPDALAQPATNLQLRTATLNGSVNPNYLSSTVVFEWGTTIAYGNRVIPEPSSVSGNTPVNLSVDLAGLAIGTTYHFRIVSTNELGTANSNDKTFRTLGDIPLALPGSASNLQYNSASVSGQINPNYLQTDVVLEYGTTTAYGNTSIISEGPFTGGSTVNIASNLSGLIRGTLYHIRIKATNELGTTYSNDFTFTTLAPINDIEGNTYNIKTIGTQIWMTENLKTTKYNNGDLIGTTDPLTLDISKQAAPKYQWAYEGNESYAATYGRLYTGYAVTDPRKICPSGWHIPSDAEWTTLTNYLVNTGYGYEGSGDDIGKSMAATSLWAYNSTPGNVGNDLATNNTSGFSALPAGYRSNDDNVDGIFVTLNWICSWWSSNDLTDKLAWQRIMQNQFNNVTRSYLGTKRNGISVRCIKD